MIVETKSNQNREKAKMKQIRTLFNMVGVIALLALMVGVRHHSDLSTGKSEHARSRRL